MFVGWLAGALGNSMFDGNSMLVGASGGVYALIGAHLAIVIMVTQLARTCMSIACITPRVRFRTGRR